MDLLDNVTSQRIFLYHDRRRILGELDALADAQSRPIEKDEALSSFLNASMNARKVRDLAGVLRELWGKLQEGEGILALQERALLEAEEILRQAVQKARSAVVPLGVADCRPEFADSSSSVSQSTDEDPLAKDYYARCREANRLRDELVEHEAEYALHRQKYHQMLKERIGLFVSTSQKMRSLWEQCKQQKLEVESPILPPVGEDPLLLQLCGTSHRVLDYMLSKSGEPDFLDCVDALVVGDSDTKTRVMSWLDKVDTQTSHSYCRRLWSTGTARRLSIRLGDGVRRIPYRITRWLGRISLSEEITWETMLPPT